MTYKLTDRKFEASRNEFNLNPFIKLQCNYGELVLRQWTCDNFVHSILAIVRQVVYALWPLS